ncbi:MAG: ATP-binding protein [Pyrinomonadaceae bacterium]
MMFSSIRAKLTLLYTFALALVIVAFSVLIYFSFLSILHSETDANLAEMANNFVVAVNAEQNDEEARPLPAENVGEAIDAFRFRDYQFVIVSQDGRTVGKTAEFDIPVDLTTATSTPFADRAILGQPYRVFQHSFVLDGEAFRVFVFHSLAGRTEIEDRLRYSLLIVVPLALLLAGVTGYFVARRSFRPIQQMSERAGQITSQNLHERLPVANEKDELGGLATAFNGLLDRLDSSFEQQRRFMADASHELRTPLAIVRGESEVALSKDDRTVGEYKESLAIVHDESKRLTQIVDDLFTLARADSGNFTANFSQVYLDELAGECVRSVRTLADKRNISINYAAENMLVSGDESLLLRLLMNLLDNAIKYNHTGGSISIIVGKDQISITNTGPEIPTDEQGLIFERFYRIDKGRSRSKLSTTSGVGLGLSISQWIAELHRAKLALTSSINGENTFTLSFPN